MSQTTLNPEEQAVLERLLHTGAITQAQADEAVRIHQHNQTPLLDILGAFGYVNPKAYAGELSEVKQTGYLGALVGSEHFAYAPEFVRLFDPAVLTRFRFFPMQRVGEMVVVMAADPDEPQIEPAVRAIVPDAEIVTLVGTERDITRLVSAVFQESLLHKAINDLREKDAIQSASRVFTVPQIVVFVLLLVLLIGGLILNFWLTARLLIAGISVMYISALAYKLLLTITGIMVRRQRGTDKQIDAIPDAELPLYSILVPVYKEPEVVPRLLKALARMDYPREKLDVLLLMEEDDHVTIEAAKAANPPSFFRFILVPASQPRTKPKACNYGLSFCRGEYVTIYDAEDIPEPDQLRKAVAAFHNGEKSLICVQAALNYFNKNENWLTRLFTLEYSYWFDCLLPGLDRLKLPIPLGGTSNHFRLDRLRELLAWDPFNVTEDADLGIRASINGYTVGVIKSTTYEEANKAPKNWIRQRSRWIKGYMITWLVHNRRPLWTLKRIGLKNWLSYQFFIGGTFAIFLINPLMWLLFVIWLLWQPGWESILFRGWVYDLALFSLIVGNGLGIILNMLAVWARGFWSLIPFALTNPIYWWMHSIAAYMALWQLITKPFYWEKTHHGLTTVKIEDVIGEVQGEAA